jgi:polyisoprenyl-teichoic acid--peptidoglycan teichoic acid transferase
MKKEKTSTGMKVVRVIFLIILVLILGFGYYVFSLFHRINPKNPEAMKIRNNFQINWTDRINILLIGTDNRIDINMGTRSDTMILLNLDLKNKNIRFMSIPRDTWVEVPGHNFDKINSTINEDYFEDGGVGLTLKTVEKLIESDVKLYVQLDFEAFKRVVDAIGGVELKVEKDMVYVDPTDGTNINLKEGLQILDGDKALQYVRFRHDAQGDFARDSEGVIYGRVARQMHFMWALAHKLSKTRNLLVVNQIINIATRYTETNLDSSELLKLAMLFRDINVELNVKALNFPGTPEMIGEVSAVKPDFVQLKELIQKELKAPLP